MTYKLQHNWPRIHVGRSGTSSPIVSPRSRPKKPSSNLLKSQFTFPTIFLKPLSTLPKLIFKVPSTIPNCVPGHFPSFISRFARERPSKVVVTCCDFVLGRGGRAYSEPSASSTLGWTLPCEWVEMHQKTTKNQVKLKIKF